MARIVAELEPEPRFRIATGWVQRRSLVCEASQHTVESSLNPTWRRIVAGALCVFAAIAHAQDAHAPLQLAGRTPIAGYDGDFDHLAADEAGHRLFVAGEDGGTLEIFDLRDGRHLRSVPNMGTPHAPRYLPQQHRLLVTNSGGTGMTQLLDDASFRIVGQLPLTPGADALGWDASLQHAWIVAGGKNAVPALPYTTVADVDVRTGRKLGEVRFATDFVEGVAIEQQGERAFVNVAGLHQVAVVEKQAHRVLATWTLQEGRDNSSIALDEAHARLFVVTRKPFQLLVLDTHDGHTVAHFDAPQRTNDIFWDAEARRLYLLGDDHVATIQQDDADHYRELAPVPSAHGAKTGLLVPRLGLLYVAVAGSKEQPAELLRYRLRSDAP
jgi:hypothetical protein